MNRPTLQSNVSIQIALAFLEFLSIVQSSNGEDKGKLDNLKEVLMNVFNVNQAMEATVPAVSLYDFFALDVGEATEQNDETSETENIGLASMGLFHEFHVAVAGIGFFGSSVGEDYLKRKSHAKQIFKEAIAVLKSCGHETFNHMNLADGLKMLGNNAMHLKLYGKAVVMYSCALALVKDNAIYFCNRAAAFTQIGKLNEAISDCGEAIKLNSNYVTAFYRLGYAYYEQGNNLDAIREGFMKVLQLEPNNNGAKAHLALANSKLKGEVELITEQVDRLIRTESVAPASGVGQTRMLTIRGLEEGGDGKFEVVEETGETSGAAGGGDGEPTISVAEFIERTVLTTPPPE